MEMPTRRAGTVTGFIERHPVITGVTELLFFIAVVAVVYRDGTIEFPRKDHPYYLMERLYAGSDWDWFVRSLSFNRTRLLAPGDVAAFRPGLMAVLAVQDIFLRTRLDVQGWIAFTMYGTAAWSLFRVAGLFAGRLAALAVTLLFAMQYAGIEMVLWHHITPYIIGFSLFNGALYLAARDDAPSVRSMVMAGACIFLGALFHESIAIAAVATAFGISFVLGNDVPSRRRMLVAVFVIPAAAYVALNGVDYLLVRPGAIAAQGGNLSGPVRPFSVDGFVDIMRFIGAAGCAFLMPYAVDLSIDQHGWLFAWKLADASPVSLAAGMMLFAAAVTAGAVAIVRLRHVVPRRQLIPVTGHLVFLLTLVTLVGAVRVMPRGTGYLDTATYYYALTTGSLCVLAAAAARYAARSGMLLVCAAMTVLAGVNGYHVVTALDNHAGDKAFSYKLVQDVRSALASNPGFCYDGYLATDEQARYRMGANLWFMLFDDYLCGAQTRKTPLVVASDATGKLTLAEVHVASRIEFEPMPLRHDAASYRTTAEGFVSVTPSGAMIATSSCLVSDAGLSGRSFAFDVRNAGSFMVLLGIGGAGAVTGVVFENNDVMFVVNGESRFVTHVPWRMLGTDVHVGFLHAGECIAITLNGRPVACLSREYVKDGAVGIAAMRNITGPQVFSGFRVAGRPDPFAATISTVERLRLPSASH